MRRGLSPSPRSSCYPSEPQALPSAAYDLPLLYKNRAVPKGPAPPSITFLRGPVNAPQRPHQEADQLKCSQAKALRPERADQLLPDRAFHLQLDQAVQLDGVLQRKLLGYRLDKAVDDHRDGLFLGEPAAREVEELVLPDLGDRCLVLGVDLLLLDLDVRIRVRPRVLIQQERVALDTALGVVAALVHLQKPAVRAPARPLGDGLGGDQARSVRRGVYDLAARVLVLPIAGVGDGEDLSARALADQVHRRVLHGQLGAQVAVHPLDSGVLVGHAPLGHQVVGVVRPVLDGRVTDARPRLGDQLDHRRMQRVRGIRRGRATLDVVDVGILVGDDERPLELPHVLRVDAEVRLKRDIHADAGRDVHERAARPYGRVQRRELVVVRRDDGAEVLFDDVLVLALTRVHIQEDDALLFELLLQGVVDDLGLVLRPDTGQALPLGLRYAELLEGVLYVVGHIVPGATLVLHRPYVVVDVVVVHRGEVAAPGRGRLLEERLQRLQPELQHPLRLVLMLGDHGHDLRVYALPRGSEEVLLRIAETVLVLVEAELLNSPVFRHFLVPSLALRASAELLAHPVVALLLQLLGELLAARGHKPAIEHDVDVIRLDVP